MKVERVAQIANFNVVIGENEAPMLEYFDTLIYPAFTSDFSRKEKDVEYLFKGVKLVHDKNENFVLVGKLVKKTVLDVCSDIDPEGELIEKDEHYSSAPYSTFAIFLKNHRMVLVPNQKGSPTLASFRSTVCRVFSEYRKQINENVDDEKKIPEPIVKVVGIPSVKSMREALSTVERVHELKLRFYPLNGDIDFAGLFGNMTTELRKTVGSKNGETILKSPKNVEGIAKVLEEAAGTVEPVLTVTTKEKAKVKLKENEITERYKIKLSEDNSFEEESKEVVKETEGLNLIEYSNENHENIYKRNKEKIIKFVSKNS